MQKLLLPAKLPLWNQRATVKVKIGTCLSNASFQSRINICACTLAQTIFNLVKGGNFRGQFRNTISWSKALLSPGVPWASSLDVQADVHQLQVDTWKNPRNILAVCSQLVKRIQTRSLYLGFVLCLSVLSSPNLTLCNILCFLYLNRDWALSVGIPLGYITMAFWTSVFIFFFWNS